MHMTSLGNLRLEPALRSVAEKAFVATHSKTNAFEPANQHFDPIPLLRPCSFNSA